MTPQADLFEGGGSVETRWFHVVQSMIHSNKIAEMGMPAFCVYCVLKSYVGHANGRAFPGRELICEHLAMSEASVDRALVTLTKMGYVNKIKTGRHNSYELTERFPMKTDAGEVIGHGESRYVPQQFQQMLEQLREIAKTGKHAGGIEIKIVLNANFITQGENGTVNNNVYQAPVVEVTHKDGDTI